jgi:FSR family fosmidomycin resistance protein-like MFS transporter
MRRDFGLNYTEIGFLLALPGLVAAAIEPAFGLFADSGRRRLIVVTGGLAFAAGLALTAAAPGFAWLLVGFIVIYPASGAFVSLSQASLMDLQPGRHEVNMARWTLAGSVGAVLGPLVLTAALAVGSGWRGVFVGLALLTLPLVAGARSVPPTPAVHESFRAALRGAVEAVRRGSVIRWLVVLEATDLMGDVLLGYLALYFVDVVGLSPIAAAAVIVVWTVAGLIGDALLLLILARASGLGYLRVSAVVALFIFPAFLLAPAAAVKVGLLAVLAILHAGWYAIPQGRLFTELGDKTGTAVALSSLGTAAGSLLPLAIGMIAERAGLQGALWISMLAPLAILFLAKPEKR